MIELHTKEGYTLEIYDTSCIKSMYSIYGGLKGEYTQLKLYGLSCKTVTVLETKKQIARILEAKREQLKETEDDTNQMYKYTTEDVIMVASKGNKVTTKDRNGKEIEVAEIIKVETLLKHQSMFMAREIKEEFYIKPTGRGRYLND